MDEKLLQARREEEAQRRLVSLLHLRHDQGGHPLPQTEQELLMEAEDELLALTRLRRELETQADHMAIVDTASEERSTKSIMLGADTTGIEARVVPRMSHVPTGIVHMLDPERTPLVTFEVRYLGREYVRLRLTSFVEGYTARAMTTIELHLQEPDNQVTVNHLPTFFPAALKPVTEMTRAMLHIVIDDLDHKTEQESTYPIWLMARTTAYNGVSDPSTGQYVDLSAYYGAWVTPNAPEVMRMLRKAAEFHPEGHMVGYQIGADGVANQVEAIFEALKDEGIVYVNSLVSFGASEAEYMQRVRLPSESIARKSANCIDGTVLMASVLEAASLNPALVLIPRHAFLAWETGCGGGKWDYVETTMIGTDSFDAARAYARHNAQRYEQKRVTTGDAGYFTRWSLSELRTTYGVIPME